MMRKIKNIEGIKIELNRYLFNVYKILYICIILSIFGLNEFGRFIEIYYILGKS